jgi:hypothetical protein
MLSIIYVIFLFLRASLVLSLVHYRNKEIVEIVFSNFCSKEKKLFIFPHQLKVGSYSF